MRPRPPRVFAIGDRVAYSAAFLRNTGQRTGDAPFLRGTVRKLHPFGGNVLVGIEWDDYPPHAPRDDDDPDPTDGLYRVLAPNLTLVSRIAADAALAEDGR